MKKTTVLLFLFAGLSSAVWAQKIRVSESRENIGGGSHNALTVAVYGVDAKEVEKEWKSKMKDYNAKKISDNKGEMFADNTTIKEMGNNTIDIYTRIVDKKGEVDLVVAFDLGGAFLNSSEHKDKYQIAEKILHDFAVKITKDAIDYQMKTQQKALEKLNGQQKDLVKENTNLNTQITDYQAKIKKDQDAIVKNKDDQAAKQKEIAQQQQTVDELDKKAKAVE
ncbi:MAG TPA: hypothetical protein VNZ45_04995 [Bacteroidia bacterium]|jgi:hypothetical protein|nr:hypothetical protein [Bacteroidia bacterium]